MFSGVKPAITLHLALSAGQARVSRPARGDIMSSGTTTAGNTESCKDPAFGHAKFRASGGYEHEAEVIALRRLLDGHRFATAVDIGGGYGRLSVILREYADRVTLTDASTARLGLADQAFPGGPPFDRQLMDASRLRFADDSIDLVALIRVLRHLPDPEPALAEMARILRPGGYAVIEVANSVPAARRIGGLLHGRPSTQEPVEVPSARSRRRGGAPCVGHHPGMICAQLATVGLESRRVLSVSNLRHPLAKAILPQRAMLAAERFAQRPLGPLYFGPSVFILARKEESFGRGARRPGGSALQVAAPYARTTPADTAQAGLARP
jgi:SAM-dependent methyltransferase